MQLFPRPQILSWSRRAQPSTGIVVEAARSGASLFAAAILLAVSSPAPAALPAFEPGQILVIDSNASAGNGRLFRVDRTTGAATPIGTGFGGEPWSISVQSPTRIVAGDVSYAQVLRLSMNSGNWTPIADSGLLEYPAGAIVGETENTVLMASYPGRVVRVNTTTGQQSLYADYSHLGELSAWGMARFPDGTLVLSDIVAGSIVRIAPDRSASLLSTGGLLNATWGIAALPDGSVAVGNSGRQGQDSIIRISMVDGSQSYITPPSAFPSIPNAIAVDIDGDLLVSGGQESTRGALYKVRLSDGQVTPFSTDSQFANPVGIVIVSGPGTVESVVARDAVWKYLDTGANLGTNWRLPAFSDAAWSSGRAELGYGDVDEATVINCGPRRPTCDSQNFATTYFRHEFDVSDVTRVLSLAAELVRDDAAAVYLNGVEIYRDANLPAEAASSVYSGTSNGENALVEFAVDRGLLVNGSNLLAVEVHQANQTSSDVSFSLRLRGVLLPVPEPNSFALLAGAVVSGLAVWRRRAVLHKS